MAKLKAAWGIDIGQCALKALRCRPHESDPSQIVADAFDYIEYPKILSQPDANPAELIAEALKTFLSRNSVRGDKVVMSVSGQAGLARFIKLPPVETSKIPDIVKYEARQQIPFPLEEVVWDYQQLGGGSIEEGFALDSEVGLFAMKRDQAFKVLQPFVDARIEVDIVQLTPLALYNYICFDQLTDLPPPDMYDPDNPPESVVLLSMGTDTTDLVITNGFRVWQRSLPVGGNHFTKALVKEMKESFAKAEHLKRNAAKADDPKALFQAMKPVFSELLTEVQRSISYFSNIDRQATINRVVALGNVMKLPGLQKYLAQNLGFDLTRIDSFRGLNGPGVVDSPAFKENLLSFGVCYGLCLQGVGRSAIGTNLLPPEIAHTRMIRAKKPWAIAAAASMLVGMSVYFSMQMQAWNSVEAETWRPQLSQAQGLMANANRWKADYETAKTAFFKTDEVGTSLMQNVQGRDLWLELIKAIHLSLPRDPEDAVPEAINERNLIKITNVECQRVPELSEWFASVKQYYEAMADDAAPRQEAAEPAVDPNTGEPLVAAAEPEDTGPSGPGWVFKLTCYHYHNDRNKPDEQGKEWLRRTVLKQLHQSRLPVPPAEQVEDGPTDWGVGDIGIRYPIVHDTGGIDWNHTMEVEDPDAPPPSGASGPARKRVPVPRYSFTLLFCWQEVPPEKRNANDQAPQQTAALPAR